MSDEQETAIQLRRRWMILMGYSEEDILEACDTLSHASIDEELASLAAAHKLRGNDGKD